MKKRILASLFLIGSGIAYSNDSKITPYSFRPFANISAGVDFIRNNRSQSIMLLSPYSDYYVGENSWKNSGSLGLGAGFEQAIKPALLWQLGVSAYFNTAIKAQGSIWQFNSPEFENFHYQYQLQSSRIVVASKVLSTFHEYYHPYISGEIGSSLNNAYSYNETPLIEEAVPIAPFDHHVRSSFAWGVGGGIDMDIRENLRFGLGYQFADLGKARLGRSPAQETNQRLCVNHLYDNQIRIQVTALI